ncbi:ExeA family protein [Desulfomarina sp.]
MYLEFYHLNRAPFQICNDPASLWEGRNYTCSRDIINYCLMNPGKTGLITGDTGTGKSYVVHALVKSQAQNILSAVISNTDFTVEDFYHQVMYAFQLPPRTDSRHEIIKFFTERAAKNSQTLLVLDEIQLISPELTTEILQLAEMQSSSPFGVSICLVGQTANSAIEESVRNRYHFVPLSLDKTTQYLRHRLHIAGATREIFTRDAISAIYRCSRGYPGMINALCDLALYFGCSEQKVIIDGAAIQQTIEKFHFSEKQSNEIEPQRPAHRADTADKSQKTGHFFIKLCIVALALSLLAGGCYLYYQTNPEFVDNSSTRLSDTEILPPVNTIYPLPAPAPDRQDNNFDAVGYPSEYRPEKKPLDMATTSTFPAGSTRENGWKKTSPDKQPVWS